MPSLSYTGFESFMLKSLQSQKLPEHLIVHSCVYDYVSIKRILFSMFPTNVVQTTYRHSAELLSLSASSFIVLSSFIIRGAFLPN